MLRSFWSFLFAIWKNTALLFSSVKFLARLAFSLFGGKSSMNHSLLSVSRMKNIINLNLLTFELPCANFTALLLDWPEKNWMLHTIHDFGCVNKLWEKYHALDALLTTEKITKQFISDMKINCILRKIWRKLIGIVSHVWLKMSSIWNWSVKIIFLRWNFLFISNITSFIFTFIWSIFYLYLSKCSCIQWMDSTHPQCSVFQKHSFNQGFDFCLFDTQEMVRCICQEHFLNDAK